MARAQRRQTKTLVPVPAGISSLMVNIIMTLDAGNHETKIYWDGGAPIVIPTALLRKRKADMPNPDELPQESFAVLQGTQGSATPYYVFGDNAIALDAAKCIRFDKLLNAKVSHGPLMLMSAIASLFPTHATVNVSLLVSCNDRKTYADDLRSAYAGPFVIQTANSPQPTTINVTYLGSADEGQAVARMSPHNGAIAVVDIGGGDVAISTFNDKGRIQARHSQRKGVKDIYTAIAGTQELKDQVYAIDPRTPVTTTRIQEAIHNPVDNTIIYRLSNNPNAPTIDITGIYNEVLDEWCDQVSTSVLADAHSDMSLCDVSIGIGGGWLLPGMISAMQNYGLEVQQVGDPVLHNARTLMEVATALSKRQQG